MTLPMTGSALMVLAVVLGFIFGMLLHRGGVANYNVIVNQFRFKDFTVLKVMLTAIIVGGIGVAVLHTMGYAQYHIKSADLAAVILGAGIFGVGMVVYGYCPGTGVAAIASGSIHALIGAFGMIVGGIIYGLTYPWFRDRVLPLASYGKVRLPDVTHSPEWLWFAGLVLVAVITFMLIERFTRLRRSQLQV